MTKPTLSPLARAALMKCFATKGKNKGLLLSKAPRDPLAPMGMGATYAAWQGAMLACNPFKASIGGMMFMNAEQRALAQEITDYLDARPALKKVLDRDRSALEKMGVW
jgi:hypothetical protein